MLLHLSLMASIMVFPILHIPRGQWYDAFFEMLASNVVSAYAYF